MLIHSASQLLTIAGPPQRGMEMGRLNIIKDGAVLLKNKRIRVAGNTQDLINSYPNEDRLDASGRVLMPGFVDPHTHAVWAGGRANEFEMKLAGKSYLEILASGGGIISTVMATREACIEELRAQTKARLIQMMKHGTTTMEVKTGYGLNLETEIKMLQVIIDLDKEGPWDLVPTFLGAHAIPPEFKDNPNGYTDFLISKMLPAVADWWEVNGEGKPLPFVDVFCETGAFDLSQTLKILATAKDLGYELKVHADEFDNLGGGSLAANLEAVSADHLVVTSNADIADLGASETVSVALPGTPFGLGHHDYTPAKKILEANGLLAIASDLNPGTTWCENMQMPIALACRYMKLTPAQAIVAATINAAKAISKENEIGSIEKGKKADLIILSVEDYRQIGYRYGVNLVETVIKSGEIVEF